MKRLEAGFSQDFDIMRVVCNELKLATLVELQTQYNVSDFYDLLEIQEAYATLLQEQKKEAADK